MKLVAILLGLGIERFFHFGRLLYRFSWLDAYVEKMQKLFSRTPLWQNYIALIVILFPLLVVTGFIYYFACEYFYRIVTILISLLILVYCLGPSNIYQEAAVDKEMNTTSETFFWQFHEQFFAILFWFALLGPLAAIFYRVITLISDKEPIGAYENITNAARTVHGIIAWIPVRIMGIGLALVGDFMKTFNHWRSHVISSWKTDPQWLEQAGQLAQGGSEKEMSTADKISSSLQLVDRLLIIFIVCIALILMSSLR